VWLPGGFVGVDIFFVISGFLITSHLVRELQETGKISLGKFYARRMVRLIPAATLVLVASVVAAAMFAPQTTWKQISVDITGAAFYVVNWVFGARSVDYLAEDSVESPVQHFWSLSVEEQYYFVWPLLIVGAAAVAVQLRGKRHTVVIAAGTALVVLSLSWALWLEHTGDVTAYFATPARLWELGIGSVLALIHPSLRSAAKLLKVLGYYCGVVFLALSLVFINGDMSWPGVATLLPTIGVAMMIAFGGEHLTVAEQIISMRPMVWVGGLSYSLYLWHWPVLIYASYVWPNPSWKILSLCFIVSVGFAWLSKKLVEDPVRNASWSRARVRNGLTMGIVLAVLSAGSAGTLYVGGANGPLQAPADANPEGAQILGVSPSRVPISALLEQPEWVIPSPTDATLDVPALYEDGCQQDEESSEIITCEYGDLSSETEIIVVGDSKANQWLPALDKIGQSSRLKITVMTKSACSFANAPARANGGPYEACDEWNSRADAEISERKPYAVITSMASSEAAVQGNQAARRHAMVKGLGEKLASLKQSADHVILIADNPHPNKPVYECVAENADDVSGCAFDRESGVSGSSYEVQKSAIDQEGGSYLNASNLSDAGLNALVMLDMTDYICPPQLDVCPAVIGNALVYRQGSHLTATYVETLQSSLEEALTTVLGVKDPS
jgi:peptidoglycan/LPS O-acetylase OafA/YrhL